MRGPRADALAARHARNGALPAQRKRGLLAAAVDTRNAGLLESGPAFLCCWVTVLLGTVLLGYCAAGLRCCWLRYGLRLRLRGRANLEGLHVVEEALGLGRR